MRSAATMRGAGIALAATLILAGCVEQTAHGDVTVFRFERWLPLVVLAGCALGLPLGWLIRTRIPKLGYGLLMLTPVALLIIVPGLWQDRIALDQHGFTCRTGFWFSPTCHQVTFDDVQSMRYVVERGSRGKRKYKFVLQLKAGGKREVAAGDLMRQAAPQILQTASAAGIDVRDET